jgi:hypothetical protein
MWADYKDAQKERAAKKQAAFQAKVDAGVARVVASGKCLVT